MNQAEKFFLENLRKFSETEKEYIKFTYETKNPATQKESKAFLNKAVDLAWDAVKLKNKILGEMYDVSEIQIFDKEAKNTLNKLRKNERFESISFADTIAKLLNLGVENPWEKIHTDLWSYFVDEEKYEELNDDFNSWFSAARYFYRKAQAGTIITSTKLPKNIVQYFDEIKEAFAFELDRSSISLCRTLIEIALHDKLKKKGLFKTNKVIQIDTAREDQLYLFINLAYRYGLLIEPLRELAHEIRKKANNVLHIKDTDEISVRGMALKTISDTVSVIEYLYR